MATLKYAMVKRCPKCRHLIPAEFDVCPYCEGSYEFCRTEAPEALAASAEPKEPRKPLSPKAKKIMLWSAVGVVALVGIVILINVLSVRFAIGKSIMEPLPYETVEKLGKDNEAFNNYYYEARNIGEFVSNLDDNEKYKKVSYKDMTDYLNDYYYNSEFYEECYEKGIKEYENTVHAAVKPEVDKIVAQWSDFVRQNDISNYITVETKYDYYQDNSGWYTTYKPAFYFVIDAKDNVADCASSYYVVDRNGRKLGEDTSSTGSLEDLRERSHRDNMYHWNRVSEYSRRYWDSHSMKVDIESITLADGTVISAETIKQVPTQALNYIKDPNEQTELEMIVALINPDYQGKLEFTNDYVQTELRDKAPLCYELVKLYNNEEY